MPWGTGRPGSSRPRSAWDADTRLFGKLIPVGEFAETISGAPLVVDRSRSGLSPMGAVGVTYPWIPGSGVWDSPDDTGGARP